MLDVCSNRGAKREMGRGTDFKWGERAPLPPTAGDGPELPSLVVWSYYVINPIIDLTMVKSLLSSMSRKTSSSYLTFA